MKKLTQEEEILFAIFEGPVRPLTIEDQVIQDEAEEKYRKKVVAKNEEWSQILGLPVREIEKLRKENVVRLIERVATVKMYNSDRARQLRALLASR